MANVVGLRRPTLLALGIGMAATALRVNAAGEPWVASDEPDLEQRIAAAQPLTVENVCQPLTTIRFEGIFLVPNPDGKSYDLMALFYKTYAGPATACVYDLGTGQQARHDIPQGRNVHLQGMIVGPDRKLYMSLQSVDGLELYVYDPDTNALSFRQLINAEYYGQTNKLTIGTDGRIYGTIGHRPTRRAGIFQLDTRAGKLTDYGGVGPELKGAGYALGIAADDRFVYVVYGKTPWYLMAYDRQTNAGEILLTAPPLGQIGVRQYRNGCLAVVQDGPEPDAVRSEYWLYRGKAAPKVDEHNAPWGAPPDTTDPVPMPPRPEIDQSRADPMSNPEPKSLLRYRLSANAPWKDICFEPPTYAVSVTNVAELPDGRIFGSGSARAFFVFDPGAGKAEFLGTCHLEHESTVVADGKVYLSGYPGSLVMEYDPTRPWAVTAAKGRGGYGDNPRLVARLMDHSGVHMGHSAVLGADGKVYVGGRWYRNGEGGGLGWWDPKTQTAGGFWEPFTNYQVVDMAPAENGRYIVISTMAVPDRVNNKPMPEQGKLFVYDTAEARILRQIELPPKALTTGVIAPAGETRVLGMTADPNDQASWLLYGVDVESGEVPFIKRIPAQPATKAETTEMLTRKSQAFRRGPDGQIWFFLRRALLRIDPKDASVHVVGLADPASRIAFSGRDLYLSGSEYLRRLRDIVNP